jgi:hypothetical protein
MRGVGVAPGTTTLTLPDGTTIALADWIDDKMYGTVQLSTGMSTPVEAFSAGRSMPIPGGTRVQTRVDTNIPRAGDSGLPKDWEMLVYGWGVEATRVCRPQSGQSQPTIGDGSGALSDPVGLAVLFQINRLCFLSYEYNTKAYSQGALADYPQGNGFSVFSTKANVEIAQNGRPSPRDRLALVLPVHERENLGYKMVIQPEAQLVIAQAASDAGTAHSFLDMKIKKFGLIKRTVV